MKRFDLKEYINDFKSIFSSPQLRIVLQQGKIGQHLEMSEMN